MSQAMVATAESSSAMDFLPVQLQERWHSLRGWCLPDGARKLYEASASAATNGRIVEIGSYAGKSTVCIAWPHRNRKNEATPPVVAIDHLFQREFRANLNEFGIDDKIVATKEGQAIVVADTWREPITFLYIDGHHGVAHAAADFVTWEPFVRRGSIIALDDTAGHMEGPARVVRMALSSGSFDRLYEVDGITFLRKNRSLFRGLGRFPPEHDTIITDIAAVAAWTGALDPELLASCVPGENLAALDFKARMRHQRWVLSPYISSAITEYSATIEYMLAIISIQMGEFDKAIATLHKLEGLPPQSQFLTHSLDIRPFVLLRLGQACDLSGMRDKAISYYEQVRSPKHLAELRNIAERLLATPFVLPPLKNDRLLREYTTHRQFPEYRIY